MGGELPPWRWLIVAFEVHVEAVQEGLDGLVEGDAEPVGVGAAGV